jgi:hypothetical protein
MTQTMSEINTEAHNTKIDLDSYQGSAKLQVWSQILNIRNISHAIC